MLMAPPKSNAVHLDPFTDTMVHEDLPDILPMTLDRDSLRAIDPTTVLVVKWPSPLRTKYYRNLLPELQISICPECLMVIDDFFLITTTVITTTLQAFHSEDFEMQVLLKGHCPFCRTPSENLLNNY